MKWAPLLMLLAGCPAKHEPAKNQPAPAPTPAPAPDPPAPTGPKLEPITVEEVAALLPRPGGGQVLRRLAKLPAGERVEIAFCFDKLNSAAAGEKLKLKLQTAGWLNIELRPHPSLGEHLYVNAQKPPYVLNGIIQRGPWAGCAAAGNKTFSSIGVSKLAR